MAVGVSESDMHRESGVVLPAQNAIANVYTWTILFTLDVRSA